ncbi:AEC family transporter [Metabacillus sp. GX 13764]|uniref:AEC family transporter n=1 Tax=Metabacillus kandeliae TaxID=2900151 RepID=UPI001E5FCB13|nr:AEC family transporter [Metabacillus kandeliae]MCD7035843.1 AEC family transporter [Metabacillus kandeliae]
MTFILVVLPIFCIFLLGFIGKKMMNFDVKSLSKMALFLMTPVLAFRTFYENALSWNYFYFAIFLILLCGVLILLNYVIGFMRGWDSSSICSSILSSAFMNNGNYGTPVVLFVFGKAGLNFAVILMVIQQLIMCTIGLYYAAKGSLDPERKVSPLKEIFRMPIVYGAVLGLLCQIFSVGISPDMYTAISMVADSTIPTVMIILGMQLADISLKKLEKERLAYSLILKMAISPIAAFVIASFLPVDHMVKQIMVITAAMPTAANTTMYALQFNTKPEFVSSATLLSTLLSIVALPIVISLALL